MMFPRTGSAQNMESGGYRLVGAGQEGGGEGVGGGAAYATVKLAPT